MILLGRAERYPMLPRTVLVLASFLHLLTQESSTSLKPGSALILSDEADKRIWRSQSLPPIASVTPPAIRFIPLSVFPETIPSLTVTEDAVTLISKDGNRLEKRPSKTEWLQVQAVVRGISMPIVVDSTVQHGACSDSFVRVEFSSPEGFRKTAVGGCPQSGREVSDYHAVLGVVYDLVAAMPGCEQVTGLGEKFSESDLFRCFHHTP